MLSTQSFNHLTKGVAVVAALASTVGLAACGSSRAATAGGKDSARFLYATGDETWNATVKAVVDAYNKLPNKVGTVVAEPIPSGSDYATAMKTMDATGNWPAIVDMRDTVTYIEAGKLAPIPQEVISLVDDDAYSAYKDGNVYLTPSTANNGELGFGIVYNKQYFKDNDLSVPTTWDEFINLLKAIKAKGQTPLATAAGEVWPSDQLWKPIASETFAKHSAKDGGFWADVKDGKAQVSDLKDDLTKLKDIIDNYTLKGWQSTLDAQTTTLLVNNQAVMATTSSGLGRLRDINKVKPDFDAGYFLIPDSEGNFNVLKNSVGDSSQGLAISKQAKDNGKQYDIAVDFLKYYYSVDGANVIEKSGTMSPQIKDSSKVTRNTEIPGSTDYYALLDSPKLKWYMNETPWKTFSTFNTFFRQSRIAMQDGQASIDDTIAKVQAEFDKDIKG